MLYASNWNNNKLTTLSAVKHNTTMWTMAAGRPAGREAGRKRGNRGADCQVNWRFCNASFLIVYKNTILNKQNKILSYEYHLNCYCNIIILNILKH